jgi:DeoR/GlpR family transcriptional regulator of sugar metabolism
MIVTPSPATAAVLVQHPAVDVFVLGGRLQKQAASVCGAASADAASKISADIYLLGVAGVHVEEG